MAAGNLVNNPEPQANNDYCDRTPELPEYRLQPFAMAAQMVH